MKEYTISKSLPGALEIYKLPAKEHQALMLAMYMIGGKEGLPVTEADMINAGQEILIRIMGNKKIGSLLEAKEYISDCLNLHDCLDIIN